MNKTILKVVTLSVVSSTFLLGDTPNIGDIEKQVKPPKIEKQQPTLPSIGGSEYKTSMSDSGKTLYIKSFTFSGNEHISSDELQAIAKEYKDKELSFKKLNELTEKITKFYRQRGYFVARAYLPQQNILKNDNVLEIAIIEGNYGEFQLKNNSLVKDSIVQGILDYAKRENVVSTKTLEQSMLIINDTPGAVVTRADVMPGKMVGTSDFAITTEASKKYDGYALIDNTGSRYTGKNRVMVGLNINSPFEIGDKVSLSGLVSNGADLTNGRVAYSAPLMSNGLRGELSYAQTNYALVEEYKALDAKGDSKTLEAKFTYPIIRTRVENFYTNLSLFNKNMKDEIQSTNDVTKKDTKSFKVGIDYDKSYVAFGKNSSSKISFDYSYGRLNFDDSTKELSDKNGANTQGNYSKINLDIEHNMVLTKKITLESSLKMQYALGNKNLDGSEDFSIGGENGVKLYPSGELSAENGYIFNIEAKYQLPVYKNITSNIGIFYDRGKAYMANNNVGFESKSLQNIGIGIYPRYKDYFGKLQVAWNINSDKVSSEPDRNSRILFQGGFTF